MTKAVQYFTDEYLEACRAMSLEERVEYLDSFRKLVAASRDAEAPAKMKLISLKMPEDLLAQLKLRALREGIPYQTLLKKILRESFT